MRLTKLGHSCLLVQEGRARLLLDPGTLSGGFEELEGLTAVLFTHQHADHLDQARLRGLLDRNRGPGSSATRGAPSPSARSGWRSRWCTTARNWTSTGSACAWVWRDHVVIHPDIPVVPNVGYLVGGRLFHPGDAFTSPGQPVEVLAVPVDPPWLKVSEPIDYLRAVHPKVAVPVHNQVLSAAGRAIHYRQLEQLGAKGGTTLRALDDGAPAEL